MDLDADLYGDLYETDIGDQAADEKTSILESPTQTLNTDEPVSLTEPAEKPQAPAVGTSSIPTYSSSVYQPSTPLSTLPIVQQIPTYEDPTTANYRDTSLQSGYDQNFSSSEHRSVRPSEMKDDGKMFIGGLNWDTTDEGLRAYFSQFGKVDACTIMRDPAGRSRCFAFLTFEEAASVNAVMVKEHILDGKIIDPKRAIPRQEHQRATKLFIGGLAGTVTSESMREFFSQFGRVVDSTVMLDRETGRSKGFGFISLEDANVQQFLGFGHLEIDGKLIDVKLAQPRYQRESFQEDDQSGGGYTNQLQQQQRPGGAGRGYNNFSAGGNGSTNFNNTGGAVPATSGAPFDPQALATLYTRMFQMANGATMNPMMGGAMNPMMNMSGAMGGAMGMGGGMAAGAGRGGAAQGGAPRGPRGGPMGATGAAGVGPSRQQRSQHTYHPYGGR